MMAELADSNFVLQPELQRRLDQDKVNISNGDEVKTQKEECERKRILSLVQNAGDIRNYLLHLTNEKQVSRAYHDQAISGLKFLYSRTLGIHCIFENIPRPRKEIRLPKVLARTEVARLFNAVANIKHRAMLMLIYSSGLRVSELIQLKIEDIDKERKMLHIRGAKGKKDRYTILSDTALKLLEEYRKTVVLHNYLFPGQNGEGCITARTVEAIMTSALKRAGITKPASIRMSVIKTSDESAALLTTFNNLNEIPTEMKQIRQHKRNINAVIWCYVQ